MIIIVLPISRKNFLDRVFTSLNELECNPDSADLLTYVEGPNDLFEKARNLTVMSKFHNRLCVYGRQRPANVSSVMRRRQRIADIHNDLQGLIHSCRYVFLTEDDTVLPPNALRAMTKGYMEYPEAGFISGVQLGRWGYTSVGVYTASNDLTKIQSELPGSGLQPIDAAGFYCLLTKKENYVNHEFKPYQNILGPDSEFGISLKQKGLQNYVDWSVKCTHMTLKGDITVDNSTIQRITFTKQEDSRWTQFVDN